MIEGAMITGGVALSYWLDFGFKYVSSSASWRLPIAFQVVLALMVCSVILDLPESPRWLMRKNRPEEARRTLEALYGDEDKHLVEADLAEIQQVLELSDEVSWAGMFSNNTAAKNLHRLCIGLAHSIFHQICGINVIIYFAATVYQQYLGLGVTDSRIITASVNGVGYFFASLIAVKLIERAGRRKLMLLGTVGQIIGMGVMAGTTAFPGHKGSVIVAAISMFFVQAWFAVGWLAMVWLYPAEIVPLRIRTKASGLMVATTWIFNFLVVEITPVSLSTIGYRTFLMFAIFNVFILICTYYFFPETAYRSLEEIDEIFATSKGIFDVVKVSYSLPHRHGKHGEIFADAEDPKALFEELEVAPKEADIVPKKSA
jgi:sugar porter (SP) family MFS transporter